VAGVPAAHRRADITKKQRTTCPKSAPLALRHRGSTGWRARRRREVVEHVLMDQFGEAFGVPLDRAGAVMTLRLAFLDAIVDLHEVDAIAEIARLDCGTLAERSRYPPVPKQTGPPDRPRQPPGLGLPVAHLTVGASFASVEGLTARPTHSRGDGAVEAGDREIFVPRSGVGEAAADDAKRAMTCAQRQSVPAPCRPDEEWPPRYPGRNSAATRRPSPNAPVATQPVAPVRSHVHGRDREYERRR
jgi:hypothetical protein